MCKVNMSMLVRTTWVVLITAVFGLLATGVVRADPPKGQTYVGFKKCSSCHFKQFMTWKLLKRRKMIKGEKRRLRSKVTV